MIITDGSTFDRKYCQNCGANADHIIETPLGGEDISLCDDCRIDRGFPIPEVRL